MKILFVYTNINGFHADGFADGIAVMMAVTKKAGHDIRYLRIFEKNEYFLIDETVKEFKPDVVGFTSVSSQFSTVSDLTDNRVVIAGTGGELEDSANLTFDGSTFTVTGFAS